MKWKVCYHQQQLMQDLGSDKLWKANQLLKFRQTKQKKIRKACSLKPGLHPLLLPSPCVLGRSKKHAGKLFEFLWWGVPKSSSKLRTRASLKTGNVLQNIFASQGAEHHPLLRQTWNKGVLPIRQASVMYQTLSLESGQEKRAHYWLHLGSDKFFFFNLL